MTGVSQTWNKLRAQMIQGVVAYLFVCVLFSTWAVGSLRLTVKDWNNLIHLQQNGVAAQASILELKGRYGDNLIYEFEVPKPDGTVEVYKGATHIWGFQYDKLRSQTTVDILYDPTNPLISRVVGNANYVAGLLLFIPALVILAILILPFLLGIFYWLRKHGVLKRP